MKKKTKKHKWTKLRIFASAAGFDNAQSASETTVINFLKEKGWSDTKIKSL